VPRRRLALVVVAAMIDGDVADDADLEVIELTSL
jgi:hypothetical protein